MNSEPPPADGERYAVILLLSAQHVVRAEKLLHDAGLACKLIPVPRQISSDCGVCLRIAASDRESAVARLTSCGLTIVAVHDLSS